MCDLGSPAGTFRKHPLQLLPYLFGAVLAVGQNLDLPGILASGKLCQSFCRDFLILITHLTTIHKQGKIATVGPGPGKGIFRLLGPFNQIPLKTGIQP